MSTATTVLDELYAHGVTLYVGNGVLRYRAPQGAMSSDRRSLLSQFKSEIVALLSDSPSIPSEPCSTCGSAIIWRDPYGGYHCHVCVPPPAKAMVREKLMLVQPRGPGTSAEWADFDAEMELVAEQRRDGVSEQK